MATPLIVHHLEASRSHRILWMLEELGLDYEIKPYARDKQSRAPRALKDVHPLGKSPLITHGDRVVAESGAIVEYVLDELGEGRMRPAAGTEDHHRYRFFLHYAEGSLMPPLLVKLLFNKVRQAVPLVGKLIANKVDAAFTDPEIASHLGFLEAELDGRDWLSGDEPTGADVLMIFPLQAAMARGRARAAYPRVAAYVDRVEARPAYQRAIERGGPLEIL